VNSIIPLSGKVAALINERDVAINIGAGSGIMVGDVFSIKSSSPIEITDPDTGELLDSINEEKIQVIVIEIKAKYSICSTFRVRSRGQKQSLGLDTSLSQAVLSYVEQFNVTKRETLKYPLFDKPKPISEEESVVKIGDAAVLVKPINLSPENDY
jgi:hypothetical protein